MFLTVVSKLVSYNNISSVEMLFLRNFIALQMLDGYRAGKNATKKGKSDLMKNLHATFS